MHACCIIVIWWGEPSEIESYLDDCPSSFSALTLLVSSLGCWLPMVWWLSQAGCNMNTEDDAELALKISNALTQALLEHRQNALRAVVCMCTAPRHLYHCIDSFHSSVLHLSTTWLSSVYHCWLTFLCRSYNNNHTNASVYSVVIMAMTLRAFARFISMNAD